MPKTVGVNMMGSAGDHVIVEDCDRSGGSMEAMRRRSSAPKSAEELTGNGCSCWSWKMMELRRLSSEMAM